MIDANEVFQEMCDKYEAAVNANDSAAYRQLFAPGAIRIPPGSEPEHGADEIAKSEQKDYDMAKWTVQLTRLDTLKIDERWIYGIARGNVKVIAYADGSTKSFKTTKTWLFHQQDSGEWLIARQIWNLK